jgi:hypothetical protein
VELLYPQAAGSLFDIFYGYSADILTRLHTGNNEPSDSIELNEIFLTA